MYLEHNFRSISACDSGRHCESTFNRDSVSFQVFLQLLILLTGNYNFFNLLTIVLCISLLDDKCILSRLQCFLCKKCACSSCPKTDQRKSCWVGFVWRWGGEGEWSRIYRLYSPYRIHCNVTMSSSTLCWLFPYSLKLIFPGCVVSHSALGRKGLTLNSMYRSVTIHWKAVEQYITVELFNPLTHRVKPWVIQSLVTFDSMNRTLKCNHLLESC